MTEININGRSEMVRATLCQRSEGVSRLVLGGRYGEQSDSLSQRLLDRFYAAGGRLVETAGSYANGDGERSVGRWLASAPEDVVCVTKVGHPRAGSVEIDVDGLADELEQSAERLGMQQLDVVLLHRDDPAKEVGSLLAPLIHAFARKSLAGIGVANWKPHRLREAASLAQRVGGLVAASAHFSLAVPRRPLWPGTLHAGPGHLRVHAELDLPLLAWSANARGWFSGRLLDDDNDPDARRSFHTPANVSRLANCRNLAPKLRSTPTAMALAWTLRATPVAFPVIGPSDMCELDDAIAATTLSLTACDMVALSNTSKDVRP